MITIIISIISSSSVSVSVSNSRLYSELPSRVGEDAASFSLETQSIKSWGIFSAAVATVLSLVFYVWIYDGGLQWGTEFKNYIEDIANGDSTQPLIFNHLFFFYPS